MAIPMQVIMGKLSQSCYPSEQARANGFAQALQVKFPATATVLNYGSATPTVDQQDFPWYRLNPDGTPDNIYSYYNGSWARPNPFPASGPLSILYSGTLNSIDTYDGGQSGVVGIMSGPMWAIDTAMTGLIPLGADAVNYPQGTTGGSSTHTLTQAELPTVLGTVSFSTINPSVTSGNSAPGDGSGSRPYGDLTGTVVNPTGGNSFSTLPPYISRYWIKRTARVLYRL